MAEAPREGVRRCECLGPRVQTAARRGSQFGSVQHEDEIIEHAVELSLDGILDVLLSLPSDKAKEEDCILHELLRIEGRPLAALMSSLCAEAFVRAEAGDGREAPS